MPWNNLQGLVPKYSHKENTFHVPGVIMHLPEGVAALDATWRPQMDSRFVFGGFLDSESKESERMLLRPHDGHQGFVLEFAISPGLGLL